MSNDLDDMIESQSAGPRLELFARRKRLGVETEKVKMKINQPKPRFIRHGEAQKKLRSHLLELPWVETSGHPSSPYEYNNGVHAAVHSILTGMQCAKKKDVRYWLEAAQQQLDDAVDAIKKRGAKVVPNRGSRKDSAHWPK